MKLKILFLGLIITTLTACSGSDGGGNGLTPEDQPPGPPPLPVFDNSPINSEECFSLSGLMEANEELMRYIRSGDAPCVKKLLEEEKIDINEPKKVFGSNTPIAPIWYALDTGSLFFAKSGFTDKSHEVVKVLVEAGARLDIRNDDGQTPIIYALKNDDIFNNYPNVSLYLIISGKANLSETDNTGLAAYHYTILRGSLSHLDAALKQGVDINLPTHQGLPPIFLAMNNGSLYLAEILIDRGIDVLVTDKGGHSPLHYAAQRNDFVIVKKLVSKKVPLNQQNDIGATALYLAIEGNNTDIALYILQQPGVNANLRTADSTTLHEAIRRNQSAVVDALILQTNLGYDVDENGHTVVHHLVRYKMQKQLDTYLKTPCEFDTKSGWGDTPLENAVMDDNVAAATSLLRKGANPNVVGLSQSTPLHKVKSVEMAQELILFGADVNAKDEFKSTPLIEAADDENTELVKLLIKSKADVNATLLDKNLLQMMLEKNNIELAKLFESAGVNIKTTNSKNENAYFYVNSVEAVEFLAGKVDINQTNNSNVSPLYRIVRGYIQVQTSEEEQAVLLEILRKMIQLNADVNHRNGKTKKTVLMEAIDGSDDIVLYPTAPKEFPEVAELFLNAGADVNAVDANDNQALHFADTPSEVTLLGKYGAVTDHYNKNVQTPLSKWEDDLFIYESELKDLNKQLLESQDKPEIVENIKRKILIYEEKVKYAQSMIDAIKKISK